MTPLALFQFLFVLILFLLTSGYLLLRLALRLLGLYLIHSSKEKKELILSRLEAEAESEANEAKTINTSPSPSQTKTTEYTPGLIVGFFHPFCNAGGGGERVLWAAIRATLRKYPNAICIVYTGDHDADKSNILKRVKDRFNIHLDANKVVFLYTNYRDLVLPELYPHFTLLMQSLGSLPLVLSAFSLLVPDIFIDTMGYPFSYPLTKALFGTKKVPVGAYVHYPTISTDMLDSLDDRNATFRIKVKKAYWRLFAKLYRTCGAHVDVVTANSTWTARHISQLWSLPIETSQQNKHTDPAHHKTVQILFPPCSVQEIIKSSSPQTPRHPHILSIAQFRPEKRHELLLRSFAHFLHNLIPSENNHANTNSQTPTSFPHQKPTIKLILLGSVRTSTDADTKLVYSLRILARELNIQNNVIFITDASWDKVLECLSTSSVGTNAMWNEHFGIGVVEYQAAGLISVVHDSGGPKEDIVVNWDGGRTGWHADGIEGFADGFLKALSVKGEEEKRMRERAQGSSRRFGDEEFEKGWVGVMERLVGLSESWR